jgi:hypothetical protein
VPGTPRARARRHPENLVHEALADRHAELHAGRPEHP